MSVLWTYHNQTWTTIMRDSRNNYRYLSGLDTSMTPTVWVLSMPAHTEQQIQSIVPYFNPQSRPHYTWTNGQWMSTTTPYDQVITINGVTHRADCFVGAGGGVAANTGLGTMTGAVSWWEDEKTQEIFPTVEPPPIPAFISQEISRIQTGQLSPEKKIDDERRRILRVTMAVPVCPEHGPVELRWDTYRHETTFSWICPECK